MEKELMQAKLGLEMSADKVFEHVHVMKQVAPCFNYCSTKLNWVLLCVTNCARVILETKIHGPYFKELLFK